MNGMKKAAAMVIVGLAAATAVTGTAAAADKSGHSDAVSTKAVAVGHASKATTAKVPAAQKATASRDRATTGRALTAVAAGTTSCYAYTNGTGDFCQWYFQNYSASRGGIYSNDSNLSDNLFVTAGSGQYSSITNNAESDYNYDYYYTAHVTTSPNYYGSVGYVSPRTGGNFNSTFKNNVESLYWT
jgi:hypothetical protein